MQVLRLTGFRAASVTHYSTATYRMPAITAYHTTSYRYAPGRELTVTVGYDATVEDSPFPTTHCIVKAFTSS